MIEIVKGNLLKAEVETLVNAVNTVGVMGKGIALQFRLAFPTNYDLYCEACNAGRVKIGKMFVTRSAVTYQHIINFPTKKHWRDPSKIEYIHDGLKDLVHTVRALHISSIAIPALGCQNGGLDWATVKPLIVQAFKSLEDVRTLLYEPLE